MSTWSRPGLERARLGDEHQAVRRSLLVHRLPTVPAPVRAAGRRAPEPPTDTRLPSIATLHHQAKLLLGLAAVSAVVVLGSLGWLGVGSVVAFTGAATLTYLQPTVRVTA
ncbi:MAG: hypothetical protein HOV94_37595 [Saccharothrix sp.]|nr:hypothetical protein [Saccharothrix sp.]